MSKLILKSKHRVFCQDSTVKEFVDKLMGGGKADMVYTDPPYGIDIVSAGKIDGDKPFGVVGHMTGQIVKANRYAPIIGDKTTNTAVNSFHLLKEYCKTLVYWGAQMYSEKLPPSQGWIVWDKETHGSLGDGELAYTNQDRAVRIFRHQWSGLIKASERREKRVHPTQKPIALAEWVFEKYGMPNNVIDVFLGSGSTLIACEKTSRRCFGMEIDPHYVDVIIRRYLKYTEGKEKVVREDGVEWES